LDRRCEVRVGPANVLLPGLAAISPFDALFIDADKVSYPDYLDWGIKHVRPGGLIMAHNAFRRGYVFDTDRHNEIGVRDIMAFNQQIAEDPRLLGTIIPAGDGLAAAIRLPDTD
jgi:caffeoyl-CoA O-methyltransferase